MDDDAFHVLVVSGHGAAVEGEAVGIVPSVVGSGRVGFGFVLEVEVDVHVCVCVCVN